MPKVLAAIAIFLFAPLLGVSIVFLLAA